jgi:hypothetical protein
MKSKTVTKMTIRNKDVNDGKLVVLTSTTAHHTQNCQNLISPFHPYDRLLQNRKSAKKCRLKKKAEFHVLAGEVDDLKKSNKEFQDKVSANNKNKMILMLRKSPYYLRA